MSMNSFVNLYPLGEQQVAYLGCSPNGTDNVVILVHGPLSMVHSLTALYYFNLQANTPYLPFLSPLSTVNGQQ